MNRKKSNGMNGGKQQSHGVIERVKAKRGYLLSHHELLAAADPDMLDIYDRLYEHLTLKPKYLDNRRKELVWMGILSAVFETAGGPIHIARAREADVSEAEMAECFNLAQISRGFTVVDFVEREWESLMNGTRAVNTYTDLIDRFARTSVLSITEIELVLIGIHAALVQPKALRLHLLRANRLGLTDGEVYEALSYVLMPCGAPTLIEAAEVVKAALAGQEYEPDSLFKTWAATLSNG